jgi:hypothetical protein
MATAAKQKWRWEIDQESNEVKRVRTQEMHYEAFEDFKKIVELGAEKLLTPRQRARKKSRESEMRRRRRVSRDQNDDSSSTGSSVRHLTPIQRTKRRRRRLKKRVHTELRRCDNTTKLMRSFPPVFTQQCDGLSGSLATLGGIFKETTRANAELEERMARKAAKIENMRKQYKVLRKQRTRLMFNALANKASKIMARRQRAKAREQREEAEERNRRRSRSRNGRFHDDEDQMDADDILEIMAKSEPHACLALLINDHLNAAAPLHTETHLEHKLRIGDCINGFLQEDSIVAAAAKDIVQCGVQEFCEAEQRKKLIGGKINPFDPTGAITKNLDQHEFEHYTDDDVTDLPSQQLTRFLAWQWWTQKQEEIRIANRIATVQAAETFSSLANTNELAEVWRKARALMKTPASTSTIKSERREDASEEDEWAALLDF